MNIPSPSSKSDSVLEILGKFLVFCLLVVLGFISRGWALSTIWNWFVSPTFGIAKLGIVTAIGISLVFQTFITNFDKLVREAKTDTRDFSEKVVTNLAINFLFYPVIVGMGWLIHLML